MRDTTMKNISLSGAEIDLEMYVKFEKDGIILSPFLDTFVCQDALKTRGDRAHRLVLPLPVERCHFYSCAVCFRPPL